MNILDYLFFGIYNSYYKDGHYKNDIPELTAMSIFAGMFGINTFTMLWLFIGLNEFQIGKTDAYLLGGFWFLFCYFIFVFRKRYKKIYEKFSNLSFEQKKLNKFISWSYILLTFISFSIIALLKAMSNY